jgi:hypothetical protein
VREFFRIAVEIADRRVIACATADATDARTLR